LQNKKLHIVFLTPGFAESETDSTTIPALQVFLKNIRKAVPNSEMRLIAFQFPFKKKKYDWNGIQIVPLNGRNNTFKKPFVWWKALKLLKKIHKESPIDCIQSFWIGECSHIGNKFSNKIKSNILLQPWGRMF